MCYPKPGPRCSAHAKTSLDKAAAAYQANPDDFAAYEAYQKAQNEYDLTPAGLRTIENQIAALPKRALTKRRELKKKLREKNAQRRQRLDAYQNVKAADAVQQMDSAHASDDARMAALLRSPAVRDAVKSSRLSAKERAMMRAAEESAKAEETVITAVDSAHTAPMLTADGEYVMKNKNNEDLITLYSTSEHAHQFVMAVVESDPARYRAAAVTIDGQSVHWVVKQAHTREMFDVYGQHNSLEDVTDGWEMFDGAQNVSIEEYAEPEAARDAMARNHQHFPEHWRENALVAVNRFAIFDDYVE